MPFPIPRMSSGIFFGPKKIMIARPIRIRWVGSRRPIFNLFSSRATEALLALSHRLCSAIHLANSDRANQRDCETRDKRPGKEHDDSGDSQNEQVHWLKSTHW